MLCRKEIRYVLVTTGPQSHRPVQVGRDLWRSPAATPLLKQGHQEPVAQDHIQTALYISRDGDSTASLGNLCHCLVTLAVTMKGDKNL